MSMLKNEKGAVLIIALIFLILLTALGTAAIYNTTTEVKVSGNIKAASVSLYIAEGGMEAVKAQLNKSAIDYFSIDGGSNQSMLGYTYTTSAGVYTAKTLRYPLYWVDNSDNTWKLATKNSDGSFTPSGVDIDGKPTCSYVATNTTQPTTLTSANATWPICKEFTIGDQTAMVFLDTPQWYASAPTKVIIPSVSQHVNSNPMKKVSANVEIEFGNNILLFQSFRDLVSGANAADNSITSNIIVGDVNNPSADSTRDYGVGGKDETGTNITNRITGIYTGADRLRIRKSTDGGTTWFDYALPQVNSSNGTFILMEDPDTKSATGGTTNTITDAGMGWDTDKWANFYVVITNGTGAGQSRLIISNTADTLTVNSNWTTTPNSTSQYKINRGCMYSGSAFPVSLTSGQMFKVDVVTSTNCG